MFHSKIVDCDSGLHVKVVILIKKNKNKCLLLLTGFHWVPEETNYNSKSNFKTSHITTQPVIHLMKTMSLLSVSLQQVENTKFYTHIHGHNLTNSPKSTPLADFDLVLTIEEDCHWFKRQKQIKCGGTGGPNLPLWLIFNVVLEIEEALHWLCEKTKLNVEAQGGNSTEISRMSF